MVSWAHRVINPNGISIGSAVFAGLTSVTDRQTDVDRPRYSVGSNRPHIYVRSTATRSIVLKQRKSTNLELQKGNDDKLDRV